MSTAQTRSAAELSVGDQLPPWEIPIDIRLIVSGALATRDFQDVHHDRPRAQALGSPDIFMNIMTTQGLVSRYALEWAGPGATMQELDIRLGAPNHPGDTMCFSGEVTALDQKTGTVHLSVRGDNRFGSHVSATVALRLQQSESGG